ncbi:MAG: hypothetical protein KGI42_12570 [Xanthomonadaceae bacterium]|nr:hypothetical protein [Xanthomonadaceae bacterium]
MENVKVYRFLAYNHSIGSMELTPRYATLECISRADGTADLATEKEIPVSALDGDGFERRLIE